jgi:hypothetical protein
VLPAPAWMTFSSQGSRIDAITPQSKVTERSTTTAVLGFASHPPPNSGRQGFSNHPRSHTRYRTPDSVVLPLWDRRLHPHLRKPRGSDGSAGADTDLRRTIAPRSVATRQHGAVPIADAGALL